MEFKVKIVSGKKASEEFVKTAKAAGSKVIGTHNSTHHCDEVTSCVLLSKIFPESVVVRTRDNAVLSLCDIVVDVGGVYDPENNRYDHHQKEFGECWDETHATRLSSAGLVWRHFGEQVLRVLLKDQYPEAVVNNDLVNVIYDLVFECIDAGDNGVKMCDCTPEQTNYNGGMPPLAGLVNAENVGVVKWEDESVCFNRACNAVSRHIIPMIQGIAGNWQAAVKEMQNPENVLPLNGDKKVIMIRENVMFTKFMRYILKERPEIVAAVWPLKNVEGQDEWQYTFPPSTWSSRTTTSMYSNNTYTSPEEAIAAITTMMDAPHNPPVGVA